MTDASESTIYDEIERLQASLREQGRRLGVPECIDQQFAWSDFFARYDQLLRNFARGAGCQESSLDDVVCAVWLDVVHHLPTYDRQKSQGFRRWLYQWVYRRVIDDVRRRQREARHILQDMTSGFWNNVLDLRNDSQQDPLETLWRQELSKTVWEEFRRQAKPREIVVVEQLLAGERESLTAAAAQQLSDANRRQIKRRALLRLRVIAAELFGTELG